MHPWQKWCIFVYEENSICCFMSSIYLRSRCSQLCRWWHQWSYFVVDSAAVSAIIGQGILDQRIIIRHLAMNFTSVDMNVVGAAHSFCCVSVNLLLIVIDYAFLIYWRLILQCEEDHWSMIIDHDFNILWVGKPSCDGWQAKKWAYGCWSQGGV